jgi:hypothetical protein
MGTPSILILFATLAPVARPDGPIALAEATRPARMALLPAATPPVVAECYTQAASLQGFPPVVCPGGRLNVVAWDTFAAYSSALLPLGPTPTAAAVLAAACADQARLQDPAAGRSAYQAAALYYGWRLTRPPLADHPGSCPARG